MAEHTVSWYLVVKEGQPFNLKHEELILVCAGDLLRLQRLDWCRQDGPLKLQHPVAHIHFTDVAKVVSALVSGASKKERQIRTVTLRGDISISDICRVVSSPTFLLHLPSTPRPRILGGSSTGTCGTGSQSVHWNPPLLAPSPRSWCPGAGLCSASSHTEAQRQKLYFWCRHQHFQVAWCPDLRQTVWSAGRWLWPAERGRLCSVEVEISFWSTIHDTLGLDELTWEKALTPLSVRPHRW